MVEGDELDDLAKIREYVVDLLIARMQADFANHLASSESEIYLDAKFGIYFVEGDFWLFSVFPQYPLLDLNPALLTKVRLGYKKARGEAKYREGAGAYDEHGIELTNIWSDRLPPLQMSYGIETIIRRLLQTMNLYVTYQVAYYDTYTAPPRLLPVFLL